MQVMLMYWAEAYILCTKKNTEALVVASKETGLEVNAVKFKYTWSFLEIRMEDKIST
jgi:hypothetical protein